MSQEKTVRLTVLSDMAGSTPEAFLKQHAAWGLDVLDLRGGLWGKNIPELTIPEAETLAGLVEKGGFTVWTFSTGVFLRPLDMGEHAFAERVREQVAHLVKLGRILKPKQIRLLSARLPEDWDPATESPPFLLPEYAWILELYREAVEIVRAAGFHPVIENEHMGNILSRPAWFTAFFEALDRPGQLGLIWDIANLWKAGTMPSLEVLKSLKPWLSMIHVKGGKAEREGGGPRWASHLDDTSWPVEEVVGAVIREGLSPVICINPAHGEPPPGYDPDPTPDIAFLRRTFPEII